jgi:YesN/AraC family two-component response regulator
VRRVLLADDEPVTLRGLAEFVPWGTIGGEVGGTARDGQEAVELIAGGPPDIVVTDIKMPRKSGLDVARYVYENCPYVKVLILSGFSEFEYARQAIAFGVVDYLLKPFSKEALLAAVEKQLMKPPAGFARPARRCGATVEAALRAVHDGYTGPLSLESIAARIPASPSHLSRLFKKETGEALTEYITRLRVEKAKELLTDTDMPAYEVAETVGFNDPAYFSLVFKKHTGQSPHRFRGAAIPSGSE